MRKYLSFIIMLLVVLVFVPTASALSAGEVEFDKDPLLPGDTTSLWIEITNKGSEIRDVHLQLQYHSEEMLSGSPALGNIGIIDGSVDIRQMDQGDRQKVHFKIYVDDDADAGLYDLELVTRYKTEGTGFGGFYNTTIIEGDGGGLIGGGYQTVTLVSVKVTKLDNYLSVTTSDNVFAPGSDGKVTLTLKNVGKGIAKGVIVEVNPIPADRPNGGGGSSLIPEEFSSMLGDLGSMTSLLGSGGGSEQVSNVPIFTVVGSGTRFYMGDIGESESQSTTFTLAVDQSAERGNYNLPITITYDNSKSQTTEYIGVRVLSKANLVVPETKSDPRNVNPGESATYIVSIENIGKNDAKSVRVDIENEYLSGRMTDYVGTIEAGDEGTGIFDLDISSDLPSGMDTLPITIEITYQDDLGTHTFIEKGEISVKDSGVSVENGISINFAQVGMVFALLCIVSLVIYKRFPRGVSK